MKKESNSVIKSPLAVLGGDKVRKTPFPPHPVFGEEEKRAVVEAVESGSWSGFVAQAGEHFLGGKYVKALEALFCERLQVSYSVSANSATSGLHMAVAASGAGPGDEIIVPPTTMSASASAIVMNNCVPVFADIEDETFGLNPESVRKKITPRTKAIVVVHLFGHAARMNEILKIASEHKLFVIEDCAQAPLATYQGAYVGTLGDVGVFSLNQHKTVTTGEGGVVVCQSEAIAKKLQLVRNHAEVIVDKMGIDDLTNMVGWNYRMVEIVAALGVAQFKRIDRLTEIREKHAKRLTELLSGFEGIRVQQKREGCRHVYFVYPMRVDEKVLGVSRDRFADALIAEGIPMGKGYVRPIYLEPMFQRQIGYGNDGCPFRCPIYLKKGGNATYPRGLCPTAERLHEKELLVTGICRAPLTDTDFDDVLKAFERVYESRQSLA